MSFLSITSTGSQGFSSETTCEHTSHTSRGRLFQMEPGGTCKTVAVCKNFYGIVAGGECAVYVDKDADCCLRPVVFNFFRSRAGYRCAFKGERTTASKKLSFGRNQTHIEVFIAYGSNWVLGYRERYLELLCLFEFFLTVAFFVERRKIDAGDI